VKPLAAPDTSLFVFRTPEGVDEIRDE
jgi:hypothetical protein